MAVSLTSASLKVQLTTLLANTVGTASTQSTVTERLTAGSGSLAALAVTLTDGTGANQAKNVWHDRRAVAAAANDDLDFNGGTLFNSFGAGLVLTKIAVLVIRLITPTAGNRLLVGGNGPANPLSAWFADPTDKEEVRSILLRTNEVDKWTVDATHKVLRVNNPSAGSVSYDIVVIGSP